MSIKKIIKYYFENETEPNTITFTFNNISKETPIASQLRDHLLKKKDKVNDDITKYHLFYPDGNYFISTMSELMEHIIYQVKNCSISAQETVDILIDIIAMPEDIDEGSKSSTKVVKIMNQLIHSLNVGVFAEEFIEFSGMETLFKIINLYKEPSKISKMIECLSTLMQYSNALQYVEENTDNFERLIILLLSCNPKTPVKNTSHLLNTVICILNSMKEAGIDIFYRVSLNYTQVNNTKVFAEIVNFVGDGFSEINEQALLLIDLILMTIDNKSKRNAILNELKVAGLKKMLKKNVNNKSQKFQNHLDNYQKLTNEIIPGSNLEIEKSRKQIEKIEEHCSNLQKKVEYVFQNQKFYDEIVEDFIYFKKLSETCAKQSSYFEPCMYII